MNLSEIKHEINKMKINTLELTGFVNLVSKEIFIRKENRIKTMIKSIEFELAILVKNSWRKN